MRPHAYALRFTFYASAVARATAPAAMRAPTATAAPAAARVRRVVVVRPGNVCVVAAAGAMLAAAPARLVVLVALVAVSLALVMHGFVIVLVSHRALLLSCAAAECGYAERGSRRCASLHPPPGKWYTARER